MKHMDNAAFPLWAIFVLLLIVVIADNVNFS